MRRLLIVMLASATSSVAAAEVKFPNLDPAGKPVLVTDVVATSTFADKANAYAPANALHYESRTVGKGAKATNVPWSAWCEGKPDEGIGETLTIHLAEPTPLDAVKIAAGVWRTDALFAANNQPTSLEVSLDGKPQTLAAKGKAWVTAKVAGKVSTIAIKILAVKKGTMNDSCISAIDLVRGKDRVSAAIGIDAKAWAALPP